MESLAHLPRLAYPAADSPETQDLPRRPLAYFRLGHFQAKSGESNIAPPLKTSSHLQIIIHALLFFFTSTMTT
jgi:hypothetical protein